MGKRTGVGKPVSQPRARKKQRSLAGMLWRTALYTVVVGAILFVAAGFYYSGEIRDGALVPPESYDREYNLEITDVSGNRISITDTGSDGQIGQRGIEGIEWENGYIQTTDLVSSTENDNGERTDVRIAEEGATAPSVGTAVRLDPFAYAGDPEQAFGIPFETVTYTSNIDSFPAWYIDGSSTTWAIIVHGRGADLTESLRIIPTLYALDFPILVIHYRNDPGFAKDPSGYNQFGATEWVDLAAAVLYAEENGAQNHLLVGYSMGGAIVTSYLTQSPLRNRTRGAILDSPALSLEATVDFQATNTKLPLIGVAVPKPLTSFAKWIASWRFDVDWDEVDYLAKSNELHAPMLIFHGTKDESVPLATSQRLANLRPDIVTLVTTEADHVRSWNESPDEYESAIIEFLVANPG
ncbi:MAG: alpha/beta hydrolase [Acidimicrobiia bacterium]